MMTFADGGGLKSYLALYGAGVLSRRGVRVGYADWELSGEDHRDRLDRLFGPDLPTIHYFRCDRPLIDEADRITREARKLGLDYLVFDSAGFGTAGPPEAAEHALAYFRAVRQIGLGSHHLAHVNRSETGDQKPFGSSFWHNSARATWFAKQAAASADGRQAHRRPVQPQVESHAAASGGRLSVHVRRGPHDRGARQSGRRRRPARPLAALAAHRASPQSRRRRRRARLTEIAEELDAKPDTVKKAVSPNRARGGKSMFTQVPGSDGRPRIALVERHVA